MRGRLVLRRMSSVFLDYRTRILAVHISQLYTYNEPLETHVRVLVCHQTENEIRTPKVMTSQTCYHVTRSSFEAIEEHLRLPLQTLPTMGSMWGVQSSEFITDTNIAGNETMCLDECSTGGPGVSETCWITFSGSLAKFLTIPFRDVVRYHNEQRKCPGACAVRPRHVA